MKLIIDIPEEVVTKIQNGEDYRYDVHTAIAQGKPYEPKGDLISREVLKKALNFVYDCAYIDSKSKEGIVSDIIDEIDNAPTVAYPFEKFRTMLCGTCQAHMRIEPDKPQGKWIRKVDDVGFISHICSECGAEIEVEDPIDDKFCFNCGAEMRGGAE